MQKRINEQEEAKTGEYQCPDCEPKRGHLTKRRVSSRKHTPIDYAALNSGEFTAAFTAVHPHWRYYYRGFDQTHVREMRGTDLDMDWVHTTGLQQPIIIRKCDSKGLGLSIPKNLSVRDIANMLGPDNPLEVMRVADQCNAPGWTLGTWADYFESGSRDVIYNVISLEFSGTVLADLVTRPTIVRQVDLVDRVWPSNISKPKVSLYCLMSVRGSYTDFHIDFGGSSVFYNVLRGAKTFILVPPKKRNLAAYKKWCKSPDQQRVFFGDLVSGCYQVDLHEGDSFMIPSGWIHAVYTPADSLIIGGNFLTSLSFDKQVAVANIEKQTQVPRKFRFPKFQRVLWYWVLYALNAPENLSPDELSGLSHVHQYLLDASCQECDREKKEYAENIPREVEDAAAVLSKLEAFLDRNEVYHTTNSKKTERQNKRLKAEA